MRAFPRWIARLQLDPLRFTSTIRPKSRTAETPLFRDLIQPLAEGLGLLDWLNNLA